MKPRPAARATLAASEPAGPQLSGRLTCRTFGALLAELMEAGGEPRHSGLD